MEHNIRCKFKCTEVTDYDNGSMVKFDVVTNDSEENGIYFNYTPYGHLEFGMIKTEIANSVFEPLREYYIDITPAK